jgi:hypothetical protein
MVSLYGSSVFHRGCRDTFVVCMSILAIAFTVHAQATTSICRVRHTTTVFRNARVQDSDNILYIPIVFHIVYNASEQNLSDEQLYTQLAVLNEDFNKRNSDTVNTVPVFKPLVAAAGIQFYLAEGSEGRAITRTFTTHGPFGNEDIFFADRGGKDAWDTKRFLNVWVCALAQGMLGYGASPGTPAYKDGVVVHYAYVGRNGSAVKPYDLGRTLTHEIGHWLGLDHPWGTGGCDTDDGLEDTPLQEAPVSGCDVNQQSCGSPDMVQNFMNNAPDACMNFFTHQQCARMRETLKVHRPGNFVEELVTALENGDRETVVSVYPNPVTGAPVLYVAIENAWLPFDDVKLIGGGGITIRPKNVSQYDDRIAVDVQGLPNGIYVLRLSRRNKQEIYTARFCINR